MQESINVDSFGSDYFHAGSGDKTACSLHLDSAKREEARRVFPPFQFQQSLTLSLCARFTVILTWGHEDCWGQHDRLQPTCPHGCLVPVLPAWACWGCTCRTADRRGAEPGSALLGFLGKKKNKKKIKKKKKEEKKTPSLSFFKQGCEHLAQSMMRAGGALAASSARLCWCC